MPRRAREKSSTGIYHIMIRGINQQQIFEDEEDNEKFLEVIKECKAISGYKVYAYCLMCNHVHLLLKEETENLEQIFKRVGGRYVYWYNNKYQRVGHLFQDRFKSEAVESDRYLLTVLRYIHQNPIKAGIGDMDYRYSSYNEYIKRQENKLADTDLIFGMMTRKQFIEFNNETSNDKCLEIEKKIFRITDGEAKREIIEVSKCDNISEFQSLETNLRNKCIKKLKGKGLSIRQMSRLTGISKGIIERI